MEIDEQIIVVEYCGWNRIPVFHIPNEGQRSRAGGGRLRSAGLSSGVPDLMIPRASGRYHGLFIEMKYGSGKSSATQKEWQKKLLDEGYAVAECNGADAAIKVIRAYLIGTEPA